MSEASGTIRVWRVLASLVAAAVANTAVAAPKAAPEQNEGRMIHMAKSSGGASGSGTNAATETILISGEVIEGGVECPLFRTDDGHEFTLADFRPHLLPVGTRMRLRGHVVEFSTCRQGISFRTVERLE